MEVGYERVNGFEVVRWINKDTSPSGPRRQTASVLGDALKNTHGGGADCDNTSAGGFGFINLVGCMLTDLIAFLVHGVTVRSFRFYRGESAQSDVQGDKADAHA